MKPIQQLLSRIRWDETFGRGQFEIGIYDRVEDRILRLPFEKIHFEEGHHFSFTARIEGEEVTVPFHRIREVYKNGECIWRRPMAQ
jgi:uncharacterized protein (UPF0248 family)